MREREICEAVTAWLRVQGFAVHGEVEVPGRPGRHDLVGVSEHEVVVVEAKASLSQDLRAQASSAAERADRAWAAIPARRRPLPPRDGRYGVLAIEGGRAREVRRPLRHPEPWPGSAPLRAACSVFTLDRPGGLSSVEGGAARSAYRCRVWEIHRRLWGLGALELGEALDRTRDLFLHVKDARRSLFGILCRERCFEPDDRWSPTTFTANGDSVPDEAAPGREPAAAVAQIVFPRRR